MVTEPGLSIDPFGKSSKQDEDKQTRPIEREARVYSPTSLFIEETKLVKDLALPLLLTLENLTQSINDLRILFYRIIEIRREAQESWTRITDDIPFE